MGRRAENKANINVKWSGVEAKSPDNISQDGKSHSLNMKVGRGSKPYWHYELNHALSPEVEVIFDKSGSDPKCKVTVPVV